MVYEGVSRVIQGCFKGVSWIFSGCFNGVLKLFFCFFFKE